MPAISSRVTMYTFVKTEIDRHRKQTYGCQRGTQ